MSLDTPEPTSSLDNISSLLPPEGADEKSTWKQRMKEKVSGVIGSKSKEGSEETITRDSSLAEVSQYFMEHEGDDYIEKAELFLDSDDGIRYRKGEFIVLDLINYSGGGINEKITYEYDEEGHEIGIKLERAYSRDGGFRVRKKITKEYDNLGKEISSQTKLADKNGNWKVSSKSDYEYDLKGNEITFVSKTLDKDGEWKVSNRTITEYNLNGERKKICAELNGLSPAQRDTYTYDLKGNEITFVSKTLDKDGEWEVSRRTIKEYNSNGDKVSFQSEALDKEGVLNVLKKTGIEYDSSGNRSKEETKMPDENGDLKVTRLTVYHDVLSLAGYPDLKKILLIKTDGSKTFGTSIPDDYEGANYKVQDNKLVKIN